jgi:hypothetical protein
VESKRQRKFGGYSLGSNVLSAICRFRLAALFRVDKKLCSANLSVCPKPQLKAFSQNGF